MLLPVVRAVGTEEAGLPVVSQLTVQHPLQLLPHLPVVDRTGDLHPPFQVPGHQVGGGQVHLGVRPLAEAVDAGVLQEPPHDAGHVDALRLPLHAGQETADAADDELHLHPRLRRRPELVNDAPFGDGIGLDADITVRPLLHFLVDEGAELVLDAVGGHQQLLILPRQVVDQHIAEEAHRVLANALVSGHQGQVGVHGVGLLVVVAGADLGDIVHLALVPKGDETDFAVALEPLHAIHHLAPGLLQQLRPGHVVGLVKPCPQLHEHQHFLPILRRPAEDVGNLGGGRQAIDGDLDGQHVRPLRRLAEEAQERVYRIEGVEQQSVPPLNLGQDVLLPFQVLRPPRGVRLIAQPLGLPPGQRPGQGKHVPHLQRAGVEEALFSIHLHQLGQAGKKLFRNLVVQFHPHHRQPPPLFQQLQHLFPEILLGVLELFLVKADVRVPGHADEAGLQHLIRPEQGRRPVEQNFFRPDEPQVAVRQRHIGRQGLRHRQDAHRTLPLLVLEPGSHVKLLADQMGHRVVAADDDGGQDGQDVGLKIPINGLLLLGAQGRIGHILHPRLCQCGAHPGVDAFLLFDEPRHRLVDAPQLLDGRHARLVVYRLRRDRGQVEEAAHPHHEELIQVAGEDSHELQPLQQRIALVRRLL